MKPFLLQGNGINVRYFLSKEITKTFGRRRNYASGAYYQ
jgi:hypothetical protein